MPSAHLLRLQIEAALADRIPSALTPAPHVVHPTAPTGIPALDDVLGGGLPIGAITELAGPECSGRTSLALSFVACLTQAARVCAWVDVSDNLHPESAAAVGVDLDRLLWIRCGPEPQQLTLPGFGAQQSHIFSVLADGKTAALNSKLQTLNSVPRSPVLGARRPEPQPATCNLSPATCNLSPVHAPRCAEPVPKVRRHPREALPPQPVTHSLSPATCNLSPARHPVRKPWSRLDQALRATDLLLQAGGFSAIVLDMASIAPEFALRVPLATWFRYRSAAERTHASIVLLTQHACTQSSAGLVLHCQASPINPESITVYTGAEHRIEIARERFTKVAGFARKPPQSDYSIPHPLALKAGAPGTPILWQSRTPWAAPRPQPKSGRQ